ncbi:MAG: phosphoenolpyruvate--protein phosphotransferase [Filifactoraceae bacterium]
MDKGIGVSKGIALGKVLVLSKDETRFVSTIATDLNKEVFRLEKAIALSINQLENIKKVIPKTSSEIINCHIMILKDPDLKRRIEEDIRTHHVDATTATQDSLGFLIDEFEQMENEYISERALDLRDVRLRLKMNLLGRKISNIHEITEPVILVSEDIAPSLIATVNPQKILGIITERGGKTSHTAIMANLMEIPAIVGLHHITKKVSTGDTIAFNGETAQVFINPDEETTLNIKNEQQEQLYKQRNFNNLVNSLTQTRDKHQIYLTANIGGIENFQNPIEQGAEGIGLLRTEFLYLERDTFPSENEQYEVYKKIVISMNMKPVIARTLDIGGDKQPSYMKIPKEANPFLGYRAIRLCLANPEMFKTQLKALLRASVHGELKLMYPMISSIEELHEANRLLEEAKQELESRKVSYKNIKIGVTIETPAAALLAHIIAKEVDFISIGTNDLIQYTVAVDRMNEIISHLYNPLNPAVIQLIHHIITSAHKLGKPVGICGEMARDIKIIPLLIGLGIDELSMSGNSILEVRDLISKLDYTHAKKLSQEILQCNTSEEISSLLLEASM